MFAQGNRIKGHRGARIHKTTADESPQGGSATTNKFYQRCLHNVQIVPHVGSFAGSICWQWCDSVTQCHTVSLFCIKVSTIVSSAAGKRLCVTFTFEVLNPLWTLLLPLCPRRLQWGAMWS